IERGAVELSQEEMAEAVLRHLPDPVVALGPDARLLWANRRAEERFGWSLEELRGQVLDELVHPDDLATALASLVSVAEKDVGSRVDIRIRDFSNTYAWFEFRGSGWADGPIPGSVIIDLRESTDRRRWEMGAGNTEMLAAVLDAAPTINLVVDPAGMIRGASRALTRQLDRPLDGALGSNVLDLIHPAERDAVAALVETSDRSTGTRSIQAPLP